MYNNNNNNNIGIISVPCYARYAAILCTGPMFLIMNTVMYCTVVKVDASENGDVCTVDDVHSLENFEVKMCTGKKSL